MVAYRGNGARDMTSGVELFFISFVFVFNVITSVRVPPLSLRGYEGWATCGQNSLTGSPQDSLTSFFTQFLFSDLGFSFLWTRVPQLAALALHSSPKVGIIGYGKITISL